MAAAGERPAYWSKARRALARRDAKLATIMRTHPRIALRSRGAPFTTLVRSIVGQQISVKAAESIWSRMQALAPDVQPEAILSVRRDRLARAGLSQRKVEYIRDLAAHFAGGSIDPRRWNAMDDEAIVAELVEVRGIGRWTAEMFLIFNLMRPDVFPIDDLGLQRAARLHYGRGAALSRTDLIALGAAWMPWRSVATWYLWRSLDPMPVEY
jgi:DNA-3-methyladenine glycosylase II